MVIFIIKDVDIVIHRLQCIIVIFKCISSCVEAQTFLTMLGICLGFPQKLLQCLKPGLLHCYRGVISQWFDIPQEKKKCQGVIDLAIKEINALDYPSLIRHLSSYIWHRYNKQDPIKMHPGPHYCTSRSSNFVLSKHKLIWIF